MILAASIWDWDWVAIGTILLALATFSLFLSNRKIVTTSQIQLKTAQEDLELSRRQGETAQRALETQTAPLLADVPWGLQREGAWFDAETGQPARLQDSSRINVSYGTGGNEPRVMISVPFRNVGNGVAVLTSVQVMIGGHLFPGVPRTPILPAGELARAGVDAGRSDPIFEYGISLAVDGVDFSVVIGYADAGGNPRGALRLDLNRSSPRRNDWHVRELHLGEDPESAISHPTLSSLPF